MEDITTNDRAASLYLFHLCPVYSTRLGGFCLDDVLQATFYTYDTIVSLYHLRG